MRGRKLKKSTKKNAGGSLLQAVKKEMAKPRESTSARDEEVKLAAGRIVRSKREKTRL